ncbi:MAG: aconitate hydratase [Planctomycetota bacterium]|nr:aconitate hydratase [Planctomycetota bacterium]
MAQTLVYKILEPHIVEGEPKPGSPIGIRIDQTLTQDATGTTAFLLLEAMGIPHVRTEVSVSYVDHNTAQFGPENANDHLYLQTIAAKVGAYFSRPGNGICHQVHLERFGRPGRTLLGADSHTPTGGGIGMIAIGAGGLDVAVAMGGGPFHIACPKVIGVELRGQLKPWVTAKDIILRLLSVLSTRGNVGCMVEYFGPGVSSLPVPARATITNMGAELGVTCSVFPSDEATRQFLIAQGRGDQYVPLAADPGCRYDTIVKTLDPHADAATIANIERYCLSPSGKPARAVPTEGGRVRIEIGLVVLDLDELEPLAALTPSPDHIVSVAEHAGKKVNQVLIGSCTNSSYQDLMRCAAVLAGRTVHPDVELGIAPGSRQVLMMLADNGALAQMVRAGARILESACGPCIGQGFSPADHTISLRTFNRNFAGRSGTVGDCVYLVSPETAVAAALTGKITDPRTLPEACGIAYPDVAPPASFTIDDGMLSPPPPPAAARAVEIIHGPTIVKPPSGEPLADPLEGLVLIHAGDKITTDHIMPAGSLLKFRSNVPEYAKHVFQCFNKPGEPTFAQRALTAKAAGQAGFIVAGDSYGQGSSREHAALCPMYLGVRAVIAKAIERICQANLVNFGIWPLTFADPGDYDRVALGDVLRIEAVAAAVASATHVTVRNVTKGFDFSCTVLLSARQRPILAAGGLLPYTRNHAT